LKTVSNTKEKANLELEAEHEIPKWLQMLCRPDHHAKVEELRQALAAGVKKIVIR
jgi:hypothetical protein